MIAHIIMVFFHVIYHVRGFLFWFFLEHYDIFLEVTQFSFHLNVAFLLDSESGGL